MRVAIYYTPPQDHPLTREAERWLGRSAFNGATYERDATNDSHFFDPDALVEFPRRYGFHATMKAPFRLADGLSLGQAEQALIEFCAGRRPVLLPALTLERIGPFFALTPRAGTPDLDALAAEVVTYFEPLRAPLDEAELARRRAPGLDAREEKLLARYGYPYVLDRFRFHMTLTGPVEDAMADLVEAELRRIFGSHLHAPLSIDGLALFVELTDGAPFTIHAYHPFPPPRGAEGAESPPP